MSQSSTSDAVENFSSVQQELRTNEFNYRPVPVVAPVTLFLGVFSVISLFTLVGVGISLLGVVLGVLCLLKIRQSNGELGGKLPGTVGLVLSVLFLISGSSLHAYTFATEVPEGYRRIHFGPDISQKGFVRTNGVGDVHPDLKSLTGKKIFIKGYMYPEKNTTHLSNFVLVKDNQQCCFGGQPKLTDMILVEMEDGKTANYRPGLVSVAGVFHVQPGQGTAGLQPVFQIEDARCERSKTSF